MDNEIIIGRMPHYFTLWRVTKYIRTTAGAIIERMDAIQTIGYNPYNGQF